MGEDEKSESVINYFIGCRIVCLLFVYFCFDSFFALLVTQIALFLKTRGQHFRQMHIQRKGFNLSFYASTSKDPGHTVLLLSVCLSAQT